MSASTKRQIIEHLSNDHNTAPLNPRINRRNRESFLQWHASLHEHRPDAQNHTHVEDPRGTGDVTPIFGFRHHDNSVIIRRAIVKGNPEPRRVEAFLPENFRLFISNTGKTFIEGIDKAGWTLDGYVIPRLASGLIVAKEVTR